MAKNTAAIQADETTTETATQAPLDVPVAPPADPAQEIVEIFIERDPSDENPNMVIGINGKNWVMPRGEVAQVPKFVADEYNRARQAQYKADKTANEMRGIKLATG